MLLLALFPSCRRAEGPAVPERGIYHWKTTWDPTAWELDFLREHRVERLYLRLFDVEADWETPGYEVVPIATTEFRAPLPEGVEVVPTVYVTVDAVRAMGGMDSLRYAELLMRRVLAMAKMNWADTVREVQLDCDWTESTRDHYFTLCRCLGRLLAERGIVLSSTVRLHQMDDETLAALPAERRTLMLYNTGNLRSPDTRNSILDYADAEPYLRRITSRQMRGTDVAWPLFGWTLEFRRWGEDGEWHFNRLMNETENGERRVENEYYSYREERGETEQIGRVGKALANKLMPRPQRTTVLYHLDSANLSKYSYHEIEEIYNR